MSGVRSAAVGIWVGVGSRYEKRGEEGSAHFIEHMLFKGTAHSTAAELAGRMDAIGGQVNAFTSRDSTCFYARVLDSHLDEASDILCEMFFDSLFSESDVVNERGVVLEEIDMYRDTPEDIVVEQLMGRIFPARSESRCWAVRFAQRHDGRFAARVQGTRVQPRADRRFRVRQLYGG